MKQEEIYYYCTVHNRAILPEDKDSHGDENCNLIMQNFDWSPPRRKSQPWVAATIVERERMVKFKLPKEKKDPKGPFIPDDAILIDTPAFEPKPL